MVWAAVVNSAQGSTDLSRPPNRSRAAMLKSRCCPGWRRAEEDESTACAVSHPTGPRRRIDNEEFAVPRKNVVDSNWKKRPEGLSKEVLRLMEVAMPKRYQRLMEA